MRHRWKELLPEASAPGRRLRKPKPRWRCSVCGAVVACKRSQRSRYAPDCGYMVALTVHGS